MGWQNPTALSEEPDEEETTEHTAGEHHLGGPDWMNTNFFGEKAIAPSKRRRAPSPIPDTRLLFQIQEDFTKAMAAFKQLPVDKDDDSDYMKIRKRLGTQIENGYKLINRYLRTYVNQEPT